MPFKYPEKRKEYHRAFYKRKGRDYRDYEKFNKYQTERKRKLTEQGLNDWEKEYTFKQAENLTDNYVKRRLRTDGFKTNEITPDLIETKRIILKTKRL